MEYNKYNIEEVLKEYNFEEEVNGYIGMLANEYVRIVDDYVRLQGIEKKYSDMEYELKCYKEAIMMLGLEDRVHQRVAHIKRQESIWISIIEKELAELK